MGMQDRDWYKAHHKEQNTLKAEREFRPTNRTPKNAWLIKGLLIVVFIGIHLSLYPLAIKLYDYLKNPSTPLPFMISEPSTVSDDKPMLRIPIAYSEPVPQSSSTASTSESSIPQARSAPSSVCLSWNTDEC